MAYSQDFNTYQLIGRPQTIYFEDTGTGGADPNVIERHIYLEDNNGEYVVPSGTTTDYIVWPLATNPFSVDILDTDMAFNITVDWVTDADFALINDTGFLLISSTDKLLF